ncbi:hypothetical protein BHE74_00024686 [Ensete ventricosum]|nr:hypothetical protein BHE74_00024686 [Ensete ventricosum]
MRSLVVSRSLESRAEERKEVSGRNLELSRGYAAEGSEGTSLRSQPGLWRTYLLIGSAVEHGSERHGKQQEDGNESC